MSTNGYLVFISKPSGYELRERQGDVPGVGQEIDENGTRLRVSKIGPSPLPVLFDASSNPISRGTKSSAAT